MDKPDSLHPSSVTDNNKKALPNSPTGRLKHTRSPEPLCLPFFGKLTKLFPQLDDEEKRLLGFLHFCFSSLEISKQWNTTISSIEDQKRRLKRKLGLTKEESLCDFVGEFNQKD